MLQVSTSTIEFTGTDSDHSSDWSFYRYLRELGSPTSGWGFYSPNSLAPAWCLDSASSLVESNWEWDLVALGYIFRWFPLRFFFRTSFSTLLHPSRNIIISIPDSKPTIMLTLSRIAVLSTLLLSVSALTSPALDGPAAASDIQARDALLSLRQNIVYCGGRLSLPSSNRIRLTS